MDALQAKHRKDLRDLQSQITQKKKSASKKTRKVVNDECTALEQDLKARHAAEIAALDRGDAVVAQDESDSELVNGDDDLLASIASLSTKDNPTQAKNTDDADADVDASQARKPNRQKARMARRAAEQEAVVAQAKEEAANLPDAKAKERSSMLEAIGKHGLVEKEVAANGHCLYLSVADQIEQLKLKVDDTLLPQSEVSVGPAFKTVRRTAANFISQHPDDFAPFLEEALPDYVAKIKDTGEWGGQLEILALAKSYGVDFNVLQGDGSIVKIDSEQTPSRGQAWLAYYRHGFGLGEHYNSLRVKPAATAKE